jgi:hypothetical protein
VAQGFVHLVDYFGCIHDYLLVAHDGRCNSGAGIECGSPKTCEHHTPHFDAVQVDLSVFAKIAYERALPISRLDWCWLEERLNVRQIVAKKSEQWLLPLLTSCGRRLQFEMLVGLA